MFCQYICSAVHLGISAIFSGCLETSLEGSLLFLSSSGKNPCMIFKQYFTLVLSSSNGICTKAAAVITQIVLSLQAYTSVSKASLGLADHRELGKMMNTIIFHTKMVDSLVEMLVETSDLSIFWYAANLTIQFFFIIIYGLVCPCKCNF